MKSTGMKSGSFGKLLLAAASAAAFCAGAEAGTRPVSEWEPDVGDYVQSGLVLHYDGIRNAGLGQSHSTTTNKWSNLTTTTYDMAMDWVSYTGSSDSSITRTRGDTTQGHWNDSNGFVFNGRVCFMKWNNHSGADAVVIPAQYTMQFAMTAAAADQSSGSLQTGYLFMPHQDITWANGGVAVRSSENTGITAANAIYAVDGGRIGSENIRPHFSNANPKYVTVLEDSSSLRVFEGISLPASGDSGYAALKGTVADRRNNWIAIGGNGSKTDNISKSAFQGFNGTLHSYRLYSRALSEDELAWNRKVDDRRFFGILHTNAVVRVGPEPGASGDVVELGAYMVDFDGGEFSRPDATSRDFHGNAFHINGYMLETWDGSAWSDGGYHAGTSVAVGQGECVRITWLWSADAWRDGGYDVGDYVQDGLVLHLDGIRNVGADAGHDGAATRWANLAPAGDAVGGSASFTHLADGSADFLGVGDDGSAWTDSGYAFGGFSYATMDRPLTLARDCTVQAVTDTSPDSLRDLYRRMSAGGGRYRVTWPTMVGTTNAPSRIKLYFVASTNAADGDYDSLRFNAANGQKFGGFVRGWTGRFENGILDYGSGRAALFHTPVPTAWSNETATSDIGANTVTIGSSYATVEQGSSITDKLVGNCFSGTVHSVRIYNRALSDAELLKNRQVDEARFFGAVPTNAFVRSALDFAGGCEEGAYALGAAYTFTATNCVANGTLYKPAGCVVETLDAATGEYGSPEFRPGAAVVVDAGEYVRITWQWRASYVEDGLVLHYDGIRNAGADVPHSATAAAWTNLASNGRLSLDCCSWLPKPGNSAKYASMRGDASNGAWAANGFAFDGMECFATAEAANSFTNTPENTMQFAMTASSSALTNNSNTIGYLFRPGPVDDSAYTWQRGGVGFRKTANVSSGVTITPKNAVYVVDISRLGVNARPNFSNDTPRYATILGTTNTLCCFEGDSIPDSASAGTRTADYLSNWFAIGANYDEDRDKGMIQGFVGTLHSVRYYSRALGDDELAWNRKVDDMRFFSGDAAQAGTGVLVVRSSADGLEGNEPSGVYRVEDCAGYAFSSPFGAMTANGMDYRFDGCVVETWDGSGWSGAVTNAASCYVPDFAATDPSRRLTWLWTVVRGLKTDGGSLSDYVQDGLVMHLDGINNVGSSSPHSDGAGFWANLAETRGRASITNLTADESFRVHVYAGDPADDGSRWLRDGYFFGGYSLATMDRPLAMDGDFTVQVVCDTDPRNMIWRERRQISAGGDADHRSRWPTLVGTTETTGVLMVSYTATGVPTDQDYDTLRFKVDNKNVSGANYAGLAGWAGRYATAVMDLTQGKAALFESALPGSWYSPADAVGAVGSRKVVVGSTNARGAYDYAGYVKCAFYGTMRSVRIYTNVLTSAQLEQNRRVDDIRFHRTANVTNVLIEAEYDAVAESAGAYEVAGSWTFTADTVTKWSGARWRVTGYNLQAWDDGLGDWGEATWHGGESSYTYVEGESPAKVKLTWTWRGNGLFIMYF